MTTKVFVGGLSWGTGDEGLLAAFEKFGSVVEAKVIFDRDTGRSRGFGFVTFEDSGAAQNAIQQMDGKTLDGRTIRVNEAAERAPRGPGGGGGGGGGGRGPRFDDRGDRGGDRGGRGGDRGGRGGDRW